VIKLRPISGSQTFSIIPSTFVSESWDGASVTFVNDETDSQDEGASFTWALSENGNYIEIDLTPSATLKESQIYTIEFGTSTDVYYRDIVYITEEVEKNRVYTLPTPYDEYDDGDNEYIVL
jgi:hypothetical protein